MAKMSRALKVLQIMMALSNISLVMLDQILEIIRKDKSAISLGDQFRLNRLVTRSKAPTREAKIVIRKSLGKMRDNL